MTAVLHTHVDVVLVAFDTRDTETKLAWERIKKKLYMTEKMEQTFVYCGKRISQTPQMITVDQWQAASAVETNTMTKERQNQTEDLDA